MAIKGVTDQSSRNPGAGLPRLGRLYKGDEKPAEGNKPGKDLRYFRVEFEPEYANLSGIWQTLYGDEPTEFKQVYLMASSVESAFPTWMEEWGRSGLIHRCDTEHQTKWLDSTIGRCRNEPIACAKPQCKCKQVGRLNLFIRNFVDKTGTLGYFTLSTHSIYDILKLDALLADIHNLTQTLIGIPFVVGRRDQQISIPKTVNGTPTGERMTVTKSLLYIRVDENFTHQHLLPALGSDYSNDEQLALPESVDDPDSQPALPVLDDDQPETASSDDTLGMWAMDEEQWNGFLEWAEGKCKYDADDVLEALQNAVHYPVLAAKDWTEDKRTAMAAVIAAYCDYNIDDIDKFTSKAFNIETRDAAVAIAERVIEAV